MINSHRSSSGVGRTRNLLCSVSLLVVLLFAGWANAAETQPWDGPAFSGDPQSMLKAASAIEVEKNAIVTVLLDERKLTSDEQGARKVVYRLLYRVDTPSGAEHWDSVGITWAPWHQKRPEIRARVITAEGKVHELDPKTLSDAPARQQSADIYSDARSYHGPLPAVAVGAIVEQEVTIEDTAPFIAGGWVWRGFIGMRQPLQKARVQVTVPASVPLKHVARLLPDLKVTRKEQDGTVQMTFENGPMAAIEHNEGNLPGDVAGWPQIEISTVPSWQSAVQIYNSKVEPQIRVADVKELVASTITKKDSRDAIIRKLTARLHKEVRYTGLELGDSAIIPAPPAETLKRKYGDCKDKAAVLVAMLRSAGIPAHLALLHADVNGQDVSPDMPGMNLFNHAIVYLPGTPELWIDATDEYSQVGYVPAMDQGRLALVVSEKTTELKKIPESKSAENLVVESREFFMAEYGGARIVETTTGQGAGESWYRANFGQDHSKQIRENLENYVKSAYLAEELTKTEHGDGKDLTKPFFLRLEVAKGKRGNTGLNDAAVAVFPSGLVYRLPNELKQDNDDENDPEKKEEFKRPPRKLDFQLPFAFVTEWRYKIVPPPGFAVRALPEKQERKLGPAILTENYQVEKDGTVTAVLRFDTVKRRYTAEEAKALGKAVQQLNKSAAVMINLEHKAYALLQAGKVREALVEYEALTKLHPKEALHRIQRANALLDAGLAESAREQARLATELEPTSALAYQTLGWILQHDLVGRRFKKGFDHAGAVAALRKALELDAKDNDTRINLAILLEHDARGDRYTAQANLKEALELYRELKKRKSDWPYLDNNLMHALFYAGQFKDVVTEAKSLARSVDTEALVIGAIAASEGSAAALQRSLQSGLDEQQRSNALSSAAIMLLNLRMYPQAADLLEKSVAGTNNAASVAELVQAIRRTKKFEELKLDENDPATAVKKLFASVLSMQGPDESAFDLFTEADNLAADKKRELRQMRNMGVALRGVVQASGIPATAVRDIAISNMKVTSEGDGRGYRLVLQPLGTGTFRLFAVNERGKIRITGLDDSVPGLGRQILARLEANELESARRMLDWAREEQKIAGGEDQLAGPIFPRFWRKGDSPDRDKMRLAAISMVAGTKSIKPYYEELKAARDKAQGESERIRLNLAVAAAAAELDDWTELAKTAEWLMKADADSDAAFAMFAQAHMELGDWKRFQAVADERLKRASDNLNTVRMVVHVAEAQGDMKRAMALMRPFIDSGKAEAMDLNNYAWDSLFTGELTDSILETAQKANQMLNRREPSVLHTLACLYAELGRTVEARQLLLQAMDEENLEEPDGSIWYGFGRIAEIYGEDAGATNAYKRVEAPEKGTPKPNSTFSLAEKRMAVIAAAAKKGETISKK